MTNQTIDGGNDEDNAFTQPVGEADFIDNIQEAMCFSLTSNLDSDASEIKDPLLRSIIRSAKIPIHVCLTNATLGKEEIRDHFKMVPRFSYFDSLASYILRNNDCNYIFRYNGILCDDRFPVGVVYDLLDPDEIPWKLM